MRVDIHTHYIPQEFIDEIKKSGAGQKLDAEIITNDKGVEMVRHKQGYIYPLYKGFYCKEARLEDMDKRGIDIDVLSGAPPTFYYWADKETAKWVARTVNDSIAQWTRESDRFLGLGTLPLQSVEDSLKEMEYIVETLGMKGIQIGPNVEEKGIWEPEFFPIFELADKYGLFILIHPYYVGDKPMLKNYYLTNLIGNPLETTICISSLIFGGVLEKFPNIKWGLVHGGGYFPYQRGRLEHGFEVRPEPKVNIKVPPSRFLDQIYTDTITFYLPALRYNIESMGVDHVLLGSDYPFDMADFDPVKSVMNVAGISADDKRKIMGLNALKVLGIK